MTDLELIHGLVDGELEGADLALARSRVENDAAFRAHFESARDQKVFCKASLAPATCSETWSKCRGRLDELDRSRRAETVISKYAWQMAACLFLFMVGFGVYNRTGGQSVNAGSLTTATAAVGPSVVNPGRVENWLATKLGLRSQAVNRNITFLGAAEGVVEGRQMWKVDMLDGSVPLTLVVIANAPVIQGLNDQGDTQVGQINGQNCFSWKVREYTCVLVGDRQPDELAQISKVLVR